MIGLVESLLTLGTAAALLVLFAVSETALHQGFSPEATRRFVHSVGAGTAATFPLYLQLRDVLVLALAFALFLTYTWVQRGLPSVHAVMRPSIGAPLFPVGLGLAALATWDHPAAFAFGALVLALADPAAAIVGERVASPGWRVAGGKKSASGSLAVFTVAVALGTVVGIVSGEPRPFAVCAVAGILTLIEGALGYGLDNLPLPMTAAIIGEIMLGF